MMFFKNAQAYRLPENWNHAVSVADLDEALCRKAFRPCGAQETETRGWTSPAGREGFQYLHTVGHHWLLCMKTEAKLLPAAVIKEATEHRAEELAEQQGYKPGRKQLKELREQITQEMLPQAFTRSRKTFAWIDPVGGWLVIDAPSPARAEDVLELLRQTLDSLPLSILRTEISPASAMADWLAGSEAPAGFTIDQDCRLRSVSEDKAEVSYVRGLNDEQIREHLTAGKLPTKLAMTFDDRVSYTFTDKCEIKRIDLLDVVKESIDEKDLEDAGAIFDAQFALMAGELSCLLAALVVALGGELKPSTEGNATDVE